SLFGHPRDRTPAPPYDRRMSTPVLATKLVAPVLRPRLVPRSRLTDRLDGALRDRHRLTLVSAPAGFGKTTALGSWLTHLREDGRSYAAAWVSLDEGDNDLGRLLDHLLAGVRTAGLDVPPPAPGSPRRTAGSWCSTTSTWSRPPRCTRR